MLRIRCTTGLQNCRVGLSDNRPIGWNFPARCLMTTLFWGRVADTGSRFAFCVLFMMLARTLLVGLGFGLRCCRNFSAAALACSGSWHVACDWLSCSGAAGLPAASVARGLRKHQGDCQTQSYLPKARISACFSPSKCSMHLVRLTEGWRHTKWSKLALPFWIRADNLIIQ